MFHINKPSQYSKLNMYIYIEIKSKYDIINFEWFF